MRGWSAGPPISNPLSRGGRILAKSFGLSSKRIVNVIFYKYFTMYYHIEQLPSELMQSSKGLARRWEHLSRGPNVALPRRIPVRSLSFSEYEAGLFDLRGNC